MVFFPAQIRTDAGTFLTAGVYFLELKKAGRFDAGARIETVGGTGVGGKAGAFVDGEIRRRLHAFAASVPAHPKASARLWFDTRITHWGGEIASSFTTIDLTNPNGSTCQDAFGVAFGPKGRLAFKDLLRPGTKPDESLRDATGGRVPPSSQDAFYATDNGLTWIVPSATSPTYVKATWMQIPGALPRYGGIIRPGEAVARAEITVDFGGVPPERWYDGRYVFSIRRRRPDGTSSTVDHRTLRTRVLPTGDTLLFDLPKLEPSDTFEVVATFELDERVRYRADAVAIASPGWAEPKHLLLHQAG